MRLRIKFEKLGPIRFTSHKDIVRIFQRCFAARGVPVSYSQGFHPHMKMTFGPPLRTGWEGTDEYMDLVVDGPPGELRDACNELLPDGLRITQVCALADGAPKIAADISAATLTLRLAPADAPDADRVRAGIEERFPVTAGGASGDPVVRRLDVANGGDAVDVTYTSTMVGGRIVTPELLLDADPNAFEVPVRVTRREQFVERGGEFVSPVSKGVLLNQS